MTYKQALDEIKRNWSKYDHDVKDNNEAVWIAKSDIADSYEVDEEWVGMKGDGTLIWAYASGCSCWDGEYETKPIKTLKTFSFTHNHLPEEWEKRIIEFAKTKKIQDL